MVPDSPSTMWGKIYSDPCAHPWEGERVRSRTNNRAPFTANRMSIFFSVRVRQWILAFLRVLVSWRLNSARDQCDSSRRAAALAGHFDRQCDVKSAARRKLAQVDEHLLPAHPMFQTGDMGLLTGLGGPHTWTICSQVEHALAMKVVHHGGLRRRPAWRRLCDHGIEGQPAPFGIGLVIFVGITAAKQDDIAGLDGAMRFLPCLDVGNSNAGTL